MLRSFQKAGIPVKVFIIRLEDDINIRDVSYAVTICSQLVQEFKIIDVNIKSFWNEEIYFFSHMTQCVNPAMLTLMKVIEKLDGLPIVGSGECYLQKKHLPEDVALGGPYKTLLVQKEGRPYNINDTWRLRESESIAGLYRYLLIMNRPGVAGFFQYTPEIMFSFLIDTIVYSLCRNQIPPYLTTMGIKNDIHYKHFPQLLKRLKRNGYEKVNNEYHLMKSNLEALHPGCNGVAWAEYDDLVESLEYVE